jgi:hypothetical protein
MVDWEVFTISISSNSGENEAEKMDVTDKFETALFQLIEKYQGQAGLQFEAKDSEGRHIVSYY